jgi:hypothetical protein
MKINATQFQNPNESQDANTTQKMGNVTGAKMSFIFRTTNACRGQSVNVWFMFLKKIVRNVTMRMLLRMGEYAKIIPEI